MSTISDALSRPETIQRNYNIFHKKINETGNNYDTTCLDLALKKIPINNYITNLGKYNLVSFNNVYTPEKTNYYTYTDYSQPCPTGWTNQYGECKNWWNYSGPCNAGQWENGTRNCNWRYYQRTCYY